MFPDNMSPSLRFHSRILPIILVVLGLYCLLERSGVTCMKSRNTGFSAEDASKFCEDQVKMMNEDDNDDNDDNKLIRWYQLKLRKLRMEERTL